MFHPDLYKNPSLAKDPELSLDMVICRQLAKMKEIFADRTIDKKEDLINAVNKRIIPSLEQAGGKSYVNKFHEAVDRYKRQGILQLKLILVADILEEFRKDPNARVLKVNDSFLKALKKTEIKDISRMLDNKFSLYVSFEKTQDRCWGVSTVVGKAKGGEVIDRLTGCYVCYYPGEGDIGASIAIMYTCKTEGSTADLSIGMLVPIKAGKSFRECFADASEDPEAVKNPINASLGDELHNALIKSFNENFDLANAVINACIYYYSMEPDVRHMEPEKSEKHKKEYARRKGVSVDDVSAHYPVTFINWAYGKDRSYTVESTWVESHLRWQRCGTGLTQVKLIMVKEHERHYKEVDGERVHSE